MQVSAGCNQKKTLFGCSINAKIEKIIIKKITTQERNYI